MMSCNHDQRCLDIANEYGPKKGQINADLNNVSESISTINTKLKSFSVPEDYIGNKVIEKINSISNRLIASSDNVDSFKNSVDSFIDNKEQEHRSHYNAWKKRYDEMMAKKSGDEHDT